ncbi:MAG: MerR family transcriptional regulator [Gemmatimonadetes bacterium]|nr:MerR family transcriptional regulator [Gemmatimonadota bacterium]
MSEDRIKVGAVAERTGLSVRTLHHYDEIGLLSPTGRTASGHRLYGAAELERLQRIQSLRQLGLSLEEIGRVLDDPRVSLPEILASHRETVESHIERLSVLRDRLRRLESGLARDGASLEDLIQTLRATTMNEKYFTEEQMQQLAERREAVGQEEIEAVQNHWLDLAARVSAAMESGADPSDPAALELAREWRELTGRTVQGFTGGDEGLEQSVGRMWSEEPDMGSEWGMGPEVRAFIDAAMAALPESDS